MIRTRRNFSEFWIWLFYALRLRGPVNSLQRWFHERGAPRAPLREFETVGELFEWLSRRHVWRADKPRVGGIVVPADWSSHPEVYQARLEAKAQGTGDCDDFHTLVAAYLLRRPEFDRVAMLNINWDKGGHTVCIARKNGVQWYLVDYEMIPITGPAVAVDLVTDRYSRKIRRHVRWYTFETPEDFRLLGMSPHGYAAA